MGVCMRDGTGEIVIEGNEIGDLGGGGIAQFLVQESIVANNLIHDTAYFGMGIAGSQDLKVPFVKNNIIERNHVYNAMKVTIDGAGMYVAMSHYDRGTRIRENLIHDIVNKGPCGGLYIDTNNRGCHYEDNVIYGVPSGRALIVNFSNAGNNTWRDNVIQNGCGLPPELVEAMQAHAGLEPKYRQALPGKPAAPWTRQPLGEASAQAPWAAVQYDLGAEGRGVVQLSVRDGNTSETAGVKLRNLDASSSYVLHGFAAAKGGEAGPADLAALGLPATATGRDLLDKGLEIKLAKTAHFVWVVYRKAK